MEPTEAPMRLRINYIVNTTIKCIEKRTSKAYIRGVGKDAIFHESDVGWFAVFEGSWEALYLGTDEPNLKSGDKIKITFERLD